MTNRSTAAPPSAAGIRLLRKKGPYAADPNLRDYDSFSTGFSWESARAELDGLPGGGLNIAHEAVDRHAVGMLADKVALRCLAKRSDADQPPAHELTYEQLRKATNRFANVLRSLGVGKGDCVFALAPRVPGLYVAALGTAIRMLMKAGAELAEPFDLHALRFAASVGEPLNPEAVVWGQEALGQPFHDNWWQTETGGIMIANFACMDIKAGSMGKPVPGIEAAILRSGAHGEPAGSHPDWMRPIARRCPT